MNWNLKFLIIIVCYSITAFGQKSKSFPVDSISGADTVCIGRLYSYTAHNDVAGTIYNWSIVGGTVSPSTGSATVNVIWGAGVSHILTVNRISIIPPYCTSLPLSDTITKEIINPVVTGNINPCSNSLDTYSCSYTRGETYDWAIFPPSAGSIVGGNHNPGVRVEWNNTSVLLPTAIVVTVHKCDLTVKDTLFGITLHPSPSVTIADAPVIACPGTPVTFVTNFGDSTYLWSFGDGTGSSATSPPHVFTYPPRTDTVMLVVRNACNCTDTCRVVINVNSFSGPAIQCASIACQNENETYSTPDTCGLYHWSVVGGTVVAGGGIGDNTVTVKWNASAGGFGLVQLWDTCSACADTTTLKIPIISDNGPITGPDVICAGMQAEYSLPLWGGTQYKWGLMVGAHSSIVGIDNDYKVTVNISTPGTYTLHGWYQNSLKLCGGTSLKTITVLPSTYVTGGTYFCHIDTTVVYALSGGYSCNWHLTGTTGIDTLAAGSDFTYTYTAAGTYILTPFGGICAAPVIITVVNSPVVDSVNGPDTVCLGRVYSYSAPADSLGNIYNWQAIGGYVVPASGTNTVTVTWTDTGTKKLLVYKQSPVPPYCTGATTAITIVHEIGNPHVTGDTVVCANSYHNYTANYTRGEVYDWAILPDSLGSVVLGNHAPDIKVLWNNVTVTHIATLKLTVHKCDSTIIKTLSVRIIPSAPLSLSVNPAPVCPGMPDTFRSVTGGATYLWDFGDGSIASLTHDSTYVHVFPNNYDSVNATYVVKLTVTPDYLAACPISGVITDTISVLPQPSVRITTADTVTGCGPFTDTLHCILLNSVPVAGYQWYFWTAPIPGATTAQLIENYSGTFSVSVTGTDGCTTGSGSITITHSSCGLPCRDTTTLTAHDVCGTTTLNAPEHDGMGPRWFRGFGIDLSGLISPGYMATAVNGGAGIYPYTFSEIKHGCAVNQVILDTVGVMADFKPTIKCNAGATSDSAFLTDISSYLPAWWGTIDSVAFFNDNSGTPAWINSCGGHGTVGTTSGGAAMLLIIEQVYYTHGGIHDTCYKTLNIHIPPPLSATFRDSVGNICEGIPVYFFPNDLSASTYHWDFNDGASNLLQSPQRTFTWKSYYPGIFHYFHVTLTVTNSIGCVDSFSMIDTIWENLLDGNLGFNQIVCSSQSPLLLNWINTGSPAPSLWEWSNNITTAVGLDSIYISGAYWVTVHDIHSCQQTRPYPAVEVKIIPVPPAKITGRQDYCFGNVVQLTDFEGFWIKYSWIRNTTILADTLPTLSDAGLPVGDNTYQVILSVYDSLDAMTCSDTSALDTVHIHPIPPKPVIGGPSIISCSPYQLQIWATDSGMGSYNWSNGSFGDTINIYSGGPYRVCFTNYVGCTNFSDTVMPNPNDFYLPYFPVGCYNICKQQLPITLYGPPGVLFDSWAWLWTPFVSGGTIAVPTVMSPYIINPPTGMYQWALYNGLCADTSLQLNITADSCHQCPYAVISASVDCITVDSAYNYSMTITLFNPGPAANFVIGTDLGPVVPFTGTLPAGLSSTTFTLTFTTMAPIPGSINVAINFYDSLVDTLVCFLKHNVVVPATMYPCSYWVAEKHAHTDSNSKAGTINSSMFVFPNPTSGALNIAYNYGSQTYSEQSITIFNYMGMTKERKQITDTNGTWQLKTAGWMPGVYIIRMEGDGKTLQVQRLVVN